MSATSAFSASSARARRPIRSRSAARATRTPRSARSPARASLRRTSSRRSRRSSRPTWRLRRGDERDFLADIPARRHGPVQGGALRAKRRIGHLMSAHRRQTVRRSDRRVAAGGPVRPRQGVVAAATGDRGLYPGRIALVSSFGADSAVLLHMVPRSTRRRRSSSSTPASIFQRRSHIAITLVETLGLTNVDQRRARTRRRSRKEDPEKFLFATDPDRCCEIRKVASARRGDGGL